MELLSKSKIWITGWSPNKCKRNLFKGMKLLEEVIIFSELCIFLNKNANHGAFRIFNNIQSDAALPLQEFCFRR
jgi:hypothetical protein